MPYDDSPRPRLEPADMPPSSEPQPDPQLQLSEGRASGLQIALVSAVCLAIIGVTIYGLGRPAATDGDVTAAAPPPQETTGAAPQTGGNVAGGDNVAPDVTPGTKQQPAQEPVPRQTKPGVVEDDSRR